MTKLKKILIIPVVLLIALLIMLFVTLLIIIFIIINKNKDNNKQNENDIIIQNEGVANQDYDKNVYYEENGILYSTSGEPKDGIEFVQTIGRVIVLYKHSDTVKDPIKLPIKNSK